jgi:hypothetical protein
VPDRRSLLRRPLVILLIAAALAIGAPVAAIAAIGDGGGGGGSDRTPTQTIQQRDDSTPRAGGRDGHRDGDCPFKDGGSSGSGGSTTRL